MILNGLQRLVWSNCKKVVWLKKTQIPKNPKFTKAPTNIKKFSDAKNIENISNFYSTINCKGCFTWEDVGLLLC
jgi:hypothetical protein